MSKPDGQQEPTPTPPNLVIKVVSTQGVWRTRVPATAASFGRVEQFAKDCAASASPVGQPAPEPRIRYLDDEGDWCELTEDTWLDAVQLAQDTKGVLRVELSAKPGTFLARTSSAATTAVHSVSTPPVTTSPTWASPGALPVVLPLKDTAPQGSISSHSATATVEPTATGTETRRSLATSIATVDSQPVHVGPEAPSRVGSADPFPVWAPPGLQPQPRQQYNTPEERESNKNTTPTLGRGNEAAQSGMTYPTAPSSTRADLGPPPGFQQQRKSYAPKPILKMYLALTECGRLTPRIMASVMANFIPLVVQRISRHTDCLTFGMYHKYYRILPTMRAVLAAIQTIPSLQRFTPQLMAIVQLGPDVPEMCGMGQWAVNFLKALSQEPFDVEVKVLLAMAEPWSVVVREDILKYRSMLEVGEVHITHTGVKCNMCGEMPIIGPKFKCRSCNFNLCGECFPDKNSIHPEHDFVCVLWPTRDQQDQQEAAPQQQQQSAGQTPVAEATPNAPYSEFCPSRGPSSDSSSVPSFGGWLEMLRNSLTWPDEFRAHHQGRPWSHSSWLFAKGKGKGKGKGLFASTYNPYGSWGDSMGAGEGGGGQYDYNGPTEEHCPYLRHLDEAPGGPAAPVQAREEPRPRAHKTYTPKPLVKMFLNLNVLGMLTPRTLASVAVSFLPLTIQRLSRHTDRISKAARAKYEWIKPTLETLLSSIEKLPEMEEFVPALRSYVREGPDSPKMKSFGTWFVNSMKAFVAVPFEKQMPALLKVAPKWIRVITSLMGSQFDKHDIPVMSRAELSHNVGCDGCGVYPIVGPRFKCQDCGYDFDLCGECYPDKESIHFKNHSFICVLWPDTDLQTTKSHPSKASVDQPNSTEKGGNSNQSTRRTFTAKPLAWIFMGLDACGMLTPHMVTSILVSFIPLTIQRISRHTDRLSRKMYKRYKELRPVLQSLLLAITPIPPLKSFVPTLQAIVNQGCDAPQMSTIGQWVVSFLKALSTLSFDAQVQVVTIIVPNWIPLMHKIIVNSSLSQTPVATKEELTHEGASCDGCGCKPIVGPLFKCQSCAYELCGECYPMRSSIHCPLHDFNCVLRPKKQPINVDEASKKTNTSNAKEEPDEPETDSSIGTDTDEQTSQDDDEEEETDGCCSSEENNGNNGMKCPFVEVAKKAISRNGERR